jgi:hypothetical protein
LLPLFLLPTELLLLPCFDTLSLDKKPLFRIYFSSSNAHKKNSFPLSSSSFKIKNIFLSLPLSKAFQMALYSPCLVLSFFLPCKLNAIGC